MIVIEGMDNSGKSTLGEAMARKFHVGVIESEGPPLSADEINARVDRYRFQSGAIFVRHPCVSNPIYDQVRVREESSLITTDRILQFYREGPTFIYCEAGTRGLGSHIVKAHDTERHLADIENNYKKLLFLYRQWACDHAHFIYRIGDSMDRLISAVHEFDTHHHII